MANPDDVTVNTGAFLWTIEGGAPTAPDKLVFNKFIATSAQILVWYLAKLVAAADTVNADTAQLKLMSASLDAWQQDTNWDVVETADRTQQMYAWGVASAGTIAAVQYGPGLIAPEISWPPEPDPPNPLDRKFRTLYEVQTPGDPEIWFCSTPQLDMVRICQIQPDGSYLFSKDAGGNDVTGFPDIYSAMPPYNPLKTPAENATAISDQITVWLDGLKDASEQKTQGSQTRQAYLQDMMAMVTRWNEVLSGTGQRRTQNMKELAENVATA